MVGKIENIFVFLSSW